MKRLNLLLIAAAAVWAFLTPGTQGQEANAPALGPNDNQLQMITPKSAEQSNWESADILQKRVSINFVNTSLENIIRTIHYQAGLNFLYDPALLEGKVMSVRLENVKLKAARPPPKATSCASPPWGKPRPSNSKLTVSP